jgi:hypothetical protein
MQLKNLSHLLDNNNDDNDNNDNDGDDDNIYSQNNSSANSENQLIQFLLRAACSEPLKRVL